MQNKECIGCPIPEKRRETSRGTQARNQKELENHDGTQSSSWERKEKKSKKTNPGTLAGTRRKEDIMMEHNATTQGRQAPQPFLEPDGTTTWLPEDYGDNPRNPTRNQEMKMEQNARRLGRQSPEPYPKTKGLRKWWWNKMPEYYRLPGTTKSRWNKTVSWKSWEPNSAPELFGQQAPEH